MTMTKGARASIPLSAIWGKEVTSMYNKVVEGWPVTSGALTVHLSPSNFTEQEYGTQCTGRQRDKTTDTVHSKELNRTLW